MQIDAYAVMAGINGIAHPSDGMVELAARMERRVRVTPSCCSIAVGEEVMALEGDQGLSIDLDAIIRHERERRAKAKRASVFGTIKVIGDGMAAPAGRGCGG